MSGVANVKQFYKVNNVVLPDEGPVIIPVELDFGTDGVIDIDGYQVIASGKISYIQGVFIDNSLNENSLSLTALITGHKITAPAFSQGFYPFFIPNTPNCLAVTTPAVDLKVRVTFYNVPIMAMQWSTQDGGGGGGGGLTNTELRAAPLEVIRPSANYVNRSIANLSGVSENLMGANPARIVLIVQNESATPIAINIGGGVAALNTAGNITLVSGGSITFDNLPPTGAITVIGTAGADVTAYEG